VKAASLLLAGGTDPTLTDNRGDDAETLARKQGNAQVADTIKVARQSFVPKTSSTPADPERPFQPGHLYRVIKTWHSKSWGEDFPQGKTFRYVGPGSATDPSILIFFFKGDGPGPTMSDWGIERDRIGIWREYFEDLGPANARKD
jgi:hypothetical protein